MFLSIPKYLRELRRESIYFGVTVLEVPGQILVVPVFVPLTRVADPNYSTQWSKMITSQARKQKQKSSRSRGLLEGRFPVTSGSDKVPIHKGSITSQYRHLGDKALNVQTFGGL